MNSSCHPTFNDRKVSRPSQYSSFATRLPKMVQWPILNNSHAYPFCKTMPGTQLFSIGIAPFFVSVTRSKRSRNYSVSESQGAPNSNAKCHTGITYCTNCYYSLAESEKVSKSWPMSGMSLILESSRQWSNSLTGTWLFLYPMLVS